MITHDESATYVNEIFVNHTLPLITKENLNNTSTQDLSSFWQQGIFDVFKGVDNAVISYAMFNHTKRQTALEAIVIVPGRCESYLKYQELAYDLFKRGYNIYIIDHRGQGLSQRLLDDLNKGYVAKFQDYVDDLSYFIKQIVIKHTVAKPYLLAHSMGGAIATRLMQDSPNTIKAAVLSSPMIGFESSIIPKFIAEWIVKSKLTINRLFHKQPDYFFGQKDYRTIPFSENRLTHSEKRYQEFVDLYKKNKKIQLGGVTTHWLSEGILAQKVIFDNLTQLKTPILMLQAAKDSVVCQTAQSDFCKKLHDLHSYSCPEGKPISFKGAYHEIFFEIDSIRENALTQTLEWFKKHP